MFLHSKKDLISGGFKDPPNQLWSDRTGEPHHETKFLFTSGRLLSVARNNLHITRRVDILPSWENICGTKEEYQCQGLDSSEHLNLNNIRSLGAGIQDSWYNEKKNLFVAHQHTQLEPSKDPCCDFREVKNVEVQTK